MVSDLYSNFSEKLACILEGYPNTPELTKGKLHCTIFWFVDLTNSSGLKSKKDGKDQK